MKRFCVVCGSPLLGLDKNGFRSCTNVKCGLVYRGNCAGMPENNPKAPILDRIEELFRLFYQRHM